MFKPIIYINNERLTLFEDENISVVSSVQKIEDIGRTFNDFSQSFTVPASQANNRIFEHYYNASVNNGFDARVRHAARIEIQTVPFKTGTIRLEGCSIKNGKPDNYRLTFFGELIDLKEVIGDDYLNALDLTQYDIAYTSDNVITGMTTGFFSEDYIFPMISTERQWFYSSLITSTTFEDRLANIAANGSAAVHGLSYTSVRPALKIMRIIEAIETRYAITFTRTFLGTTPFDNLYLWLANEDTADTLRETTDVANYNTVNQFQPAIGNFDNSTGKYTTTQSGAPKIRQIIWDVDTTDGVVYTIQLMNGSQVLEEQTGTGNLRIDKNIPGGFPEVASIFGRIITTANKTIDQAFLEIDELSDDEVLNATKTSFSIAGSTAETKNFMPAIKVMDFLMSIIRMFNLTVVPTSSTNFEMETLNDWYAAGDIHDISEFIDTSGITVNRSKIYREISFAFQEPQTIIADQFNRTNNAAYGDLETKLKNANGDPLDGGEFEIELDFEQMVYEKLLNLNGNSETNIVYGLSLDKSLSDTLPEAHIFYAIQRNVSANAVSIVQDDGTKATLNTNLYMPSHVDSDAINFSTTFGSEINEHNGGIINNSLFKLYYEDYITDSFSIKRRKYDVRAKLPLFLLETLKLNDRLIIDKDRYIINEKTVNATTQIVDFDLLNDIFNVETDIDLGEGDPVEPPPAPITGDSFNISATGGDTRLGGCSQVANATKYAGTVPPNLGTFISNEITLTTLFDGDNKYYKIDSGTVIRINPGGIVTDVFVC